MNTTGQTGDNGEDFENVPLFLQRRPEGSEYQIPAGYFEELPDRIMSEIRLLNIKPAEHAVPELFFEELPETIQSAVILEKLAISKKEPYLLDADYFDWLPSRIQDKIATSATSRVFIPSWIKQWLTIRYITSASLAGLLIFFCVEFFIPAAGNNQSIALNESDKKEIFANPEAFGFEENIVLEHVSRNKILDKTSAAPEQNEAIDYLIENNIDVNTFSSDN